MQTDEKSNRADVRHCLLDALNLQRVSPAWLRRNALVNEVMPVERRQRLQRRRMGKTVDRVSAVAGHKDNVVADDETNCVVACSRLAPVNLNDFCVAGSCAAAALLGNVEREPLLYPRRCYLVVYLFSHGWSVYGSKKLLPLFIVPVQLWLLDLLRPSTVPEHLAIFPNRNAGISPLI